MAFARYPVDHVKCWVFDLDNTLYLASCALFPSIDVRMKAFIAHALKLDPDEAFRLQKQYYRDYGTTLRGLMTCHGIDPDEFLSYVHDIDHSVLVPDPRLDMALAALPGRKLIFTNGSEKHAVNVMDRLGISRHFQAIFDIKAADYIPKPQSQAYDVLIHRHDVEPNRAAMIEDLDRNLRPAHDLGMLTVWVAHEDHPDDKPDQGHPPHVHHRTDDLADWLERAVMSVGKACSGAGGILG